METALPRCQHQNLLFLFKKLLSPKLLFSTFLEHYGATEMKGSFPYEKVKGVADLSEPDFASRASFFRH